MQLLFWHSFIYLFIEFIPRLSIPTWDSQGSSQMQLRIKIQYQYNQQQLKILLKVKVFNRYTSKFLKNSVWSQNVASWRGFFFFFLKRKMACLSVYTTIADSNFHDFPIPTTVLQALRNSDSGGLGGPSELGGLLHWEAAFRGHP